MRIRNGRSLRFPCECVSVHRGYSDPWAAITQSSLLNDGTKERILNLVAREPKTIARIASDLGLSQPAVHAHVAAMLASELLRDASEWQKAHPAENYYEPNFPIVKAADGAAFERVCERVARDMAEAFERGAGDLQRTFAKSALASEGWAFRDLAQFCFAHAQRGARTMLEQRGVLPTRQKHRNGTEWLFWAEEAPPQEPRTTR